MEKIDLSEVKRQLEYYFSDKNLSQDEFFHKEIEKSENGYLSFEMLLNCNKLKKMNATKEILIKAIEASTEIEFDSNNGVRRKENKPLPELELKEKISKKIKKNNEEEQVVEQLQDLKPKFFSITGLNKNQKSELGWRDLMNQINKIFSFDCYYFRYSKVDNEGHFAINLSKTDPAVVEKVVDQNVKFLDNEFEIKALNEQEVKSFHEKHGYHYNVCLNPNQKHQKKQGKNQKKQQQKHTQQKITLEKEIVFGNKKYEDINKLKNIFKNIINKTENNAIIEEPNHSMLEEVLKYHENTDKIKDLKNFTVNVHPIHKDSRCFFIIKKDGSQEVQICLVQFVVKDFSLNKCIENLVAKLKKEEEK